MLLELVMATSNEGKISEFEEVLNPVGIKLIVPDFLIQVEETGSTFEENAFIKASFVAKKSGKAALADDSGLCIDALNGAPGVFSARFCNNLSKERRLNLILELLKDVPPEKRTARFECCLCFVESSAAILDFEQAKQATGVQFISSRCEGMIAFSQLGQNGFGYDSIFLVNKQTVAQMTSSEKSMIGPRGQALRRFVKKMQQAGAL